VEQLFEHGLKKEGGEPFAFLFLVTYVFLLRLPSEAIPLVAGSEGSHRLRRQGDQLLLELHRRKNRPGGSQLVRGCWCGESKGTCPVHRLGPWLDKFHGGEALFPGITAARALCVLRQWLAELDFPRASEYRTHDFRRGHAKDLQLAGRRILDCVLGSWDSSVGRVVGAPLWRILSAGEWKSPAFVLYLDLHQLEMDMVIEAHADESEAEGEDV